MIHSVTLSSIGNGNHSTLIDGKYFDKTSKQTIILTMPYGVAIDRALTPNETKWTQWFKPERQSVNFTWDDTVEPDKHVAKFIEYIKKHDCVSCEGNYNVGMNPQFKLVDSRQVHITKANLIGKKIAIGNMIKNMSVSEMVEVSFLMGGDPVNKTTEQIFIDLCDFDFGICMANPDKFLSEYKAPDKGHIVYAKKAISLGIIKLDNGVYKLNNASIGAKLDDVVVYLKTNVDTYENYIKKEVNQNDFSPIATAANDMVATLVGKEVKADDGPINTRKSVAEKADNAAIRKAEKATAEHEHKEAFARLQAINSMLPADSKLKGVHMAEHWGIDAVNRKIAEGQNILNKLQVTA